MGLPNPLGTEMKYNALGWVCLDKWSTTTAFLFLSSKRLLFGHQFDAEHGFRVKKFEQLLVVASSMHENHVMVSKVIRTFANGVQ